MKTLQTEKKDAVFLLGEDLRRPSTQVNLLVGLFCSLLLIGLTNLYSATLGSSFFFFAQLRNMVVTIPAFILFGWFIPTRKVYTYTYWAFSFICLMLVIVLFTGRVAGGAQRWLNLGPVGFQPSEFAKLITLLVVARFFAGNRLPSAYRIKDMWPLAGMVGLIFVLIFAQPDFGTAGMCIIIACVQIFFVRIDLRSIMIVAGSVPIGGAFLWNVLLMPYQKLRVLNLFNPDLDPSGSSYNSFQSLIAVGSGNFFGKGYMDGTQAHLKFLPERHTDFIFSVFAEEHGFILAALVFFLFTVLTYIALDIARSAKDTFSSLVAIGVAALIFLEFAINVAMVMGIFPVVGIPLPFFSYGSSSMLTICVSLGLLVSVNRSTQSRLKS